MVMVLCCAVLCCAVLCCAVLCCAVLCCAVMLCCAVLCCAVLCCAVLCCAVLCCACAEQHLALRVTRENYVGIINTKTSPVEVAEEAIRNASFMCSRSFGQHPDVQVIGRHDFTFPYIPSHLQYILFELVKNSMRAVVEQHGAARVCRACAHACAVVVRHVCVRACASVRRLKRNYASHSHHYCSER
jgi:hypothetical protein